MGFSRKDVAIKFSQDNLRQHYLRGFFHGDPHPANIIYTKDNKIAYIDFGICGNLTKKERFLCLRYARSFWSKDFDSAFEALMQLCDTSKIDNLSNMKREFIKHMQNVHNARENGKKTGAFRQKNEFQETLRLLQRYKVRISPNVLLYFRTAIIRRNIIFLMDPDIETTEILRQLKKITVLNLVSELPKLFSKEQREKRLVTLIDIFEREITKNIAAE